MPRDDDGVWGDQPVSRSGGRSFHSRKSVGRSVGHSIEPPSLTTHLHVGDKLVGVLAGVDDPEQEQAREHRHVRQENRRGHARRLRQALYVYVRPVPSMSPSVIVQSHSTTRY